MLWVILKASIGSPRKRLYFDRRRLAAESATPGRRYFHVPAYDVALLFTVLVAAVSPLFSLGFKDSSWDLCSIILCELLVIVCLIQVDCNNCSVFP